MPVIERWKQSPSFPSYEISNLGRVFNWKRGRLVNPAKMRKENITQTYYLASDGARSREVRISVLMEETWPTSSTPIRKKL